MMRLKSHAAMESEFRTLAKSDCSCREHLASLRWPDGPWCPWCKGKAPWPLLKGGYKCRACKREFKVTTRTLFADSRIPLRQWYHLIWGMVFKRSGFHSSAGFRREFLASKQGVTAWRTQQKLRRLIVPDDTPLNDEVEFQVTSLVSRGGKRHPALVFVQRSHSRRGKVRVVRASQATPAEIEKVIRHQVSPNATLFGADWTGYESLTSDGYELNTGDAELKRVTAVVAALQQYFREDHQGAIREAQMDDYLKEFVFGINREGSRKPLVMLEKLLRRAIAM